MRDGFKIKVQLSFLALIHKKSTSGCEISEGKVRDGFQIEVQLSFHALIHS